MAKMFGQPVDHALIESVEREEKLAAALFGESKREVIAEEKIPILKEDLLVEVEAIPAKPAETNLQPPEEYKVQQVANYLVISTLFQIRRSHHLLLHYKTMSSRL